MIILIFFLIDRNNLFMVHGMSGKLWFLRRHNRLSRSKQVNLNRPINHKIETTIVTETESANITCHNQMNQDELYPNISNAATVFDYLRDIFKYPSVFGMSFIIRTGYWKSIHL